MRGIFFSPRRHLDTGCDLNKLFGPQSVFFMQGQWLQVLRAAICAVFFIVESDVSFFFLLPFIILILSCIGNGTAFFQERKDYATVLPCGFPQSVKMTGCFSCNDFRMKRSVL